MYPENQYVPVRRNNKRLLLIVVGLVIFFVLALAFLLGGKGNSGGGSYESAGKNFMTLVTKADSANSYNLLSKRLQNDIGNQEEWAKQLNQSFGQDQASYKLEALKPLENTASYADDSAPQRLVFEVRFKEKGVYTMYVVILQENGSLKIDEYNSFKR